MDIIELHRPNPPLRFKKLGRTDLGLNLTTMIDVVFLLLIYFMAATDFSSIEQRFIADLPAEEARGSDPLSIESPVIIQIIRQSEMLKVLIFPEKYETDISPKNFNNVEGFKKYIQSNAYRFPSTRPICIKSGTTVYWEDTIDFYNGLVQSGLSKITLESLEG